jgi:hypothetical protein
VRKEETQRNRFFKHVCLFVLQTTSWTWLTPEPITCCRTLLLCKQVVLVAKWGAGGRNKSPVPFWKETFVPQTLWSVIVLLRARTEAAVANTITRRFNKVIHVSRGGGGDINNNGALYWRFRQSVERLLARPWHGRTGQVATGKATLKTAYACVTSSIFRRQNLNLALRVVSFRARIHTCCLTRWITADSDLFFPYDRILFRLWTRVLLFGLPVGRLVDLCIDIQLLCYARFPTYYASNPNNRNQI